MIPPDKPSFSTDTVRSLPSALRSLKKIAQNIHGRKLMVFLDYDGTLTPIVERPEMAVLSESMREAVRGLAACCSLAVISGRDLRDVQERVAIQEIIYAGSHGFDIAGPKGWELKNQLGSEFLPALESAEQILRKNLGGIEGALVERKKFSVAVHFRLVGEPDKEAVERAVDEVLAKHPELRKGYGKKVYELQPELDWHKGKALMWLLEELGLNRSDVLPFYLGDDITDEDAFRALKDRGIGIVVGDETEESDLRQTAADYRLDSPAEVQQFLLELITILGETTAL